MKRLMSILIAICFLFTCAAGEEAGKDAISQEMLTIAEEMSDKLGGLCLSQYAQLTLGTPEIVNLVQRWGSGILSTEPKRSSALFLDSDTLEGIRAMVSYFLPGMEAYSDYIIS